MRIKIDETLLSILAFADDILVFSNNPSGLATVAADLSNALAEIGLSINWGKCSWTCNVDEDLIIQVQGTLIPFNPARVGFPYLHSAHSRWASRCHPGPQDLGCMACILL